MRPGPSVQPEPSVLPGSSVLPGPRVQLPGQGVEQQQPGRPAAEPQVQIQEGGSDQRVQGGQEGGGSTEEWLLRLKCHKCQYETNTQNELVYHIESKHQQPIIKCDICSHTVTNCEMLVTHLVDRHTGPQRERNTLDNGRWKCFYCGENVSGNETRDNHRCREHPNEYVHTQRRRQRKSQVPCNQGETCRFHRAGRCLFSYAQSVETPSQTQITDQSTGRVMWCSFQDKCDRRQTCRYKHLDEDRDFLMNIVGRVEM